MSSEHLRIPLWLRRLTQYHARKNDVMRERRAQAQAGIIREVKDGVCIVHDYTTTPPRTYTWCLGCRHRVDVGVCGCGNDINHSSWEGHEPVRAGCQCRRSRANPQQLTLCNELRDIARDAPMAKGTRTRLHAIANDIERFVDSIKFGSR